jgi:hypothetical protein
MAFITYTLKSRENFISLLHDCSEEELNRVPNGFTNNLIWNFGHVIVTQQLLCYRLAGLDTYLEEEVIQTYRKGSKPERTIDEGEIRQLKALAINTMMLLQEDMKKGIFRNFREYKSSFGVNLHSFEEAIQLNSTHETLHLGYAKALKKMIKA